MLVSIWRMNTTSFAFKNNAPNSASVANDTTALLKLSFQLSLLHNCWGWSCSYSTERNVLLWGFVLYSHLHIRCCCELEVLCCLCCMSLLLLLVLQDNLTIVLLSSLFSPLFCLFGGESAERREYRAADCMYVIEEIFHDGLNKLCPFLSIGGVGLLLVL